MRMFLDFQEALKEVHRDLSEMGLRVHAKTYQDKNVEGDPQFESLELQDFSYCVLNPSPMNVCIPTPSGLITPTQPWADDEFRERLSGVFGTPVNPGTAYLSRENVWETFRDPDTGTFAYTYSERFSRYHQVMAALRRAREDEDSRQLFISVWDPSDIRNIGGKSRVPCTIGYQVSIRRGMLNLHYIQRSADFITHFCNDVYLASKFQEYLCGELKVPVGRYTHTVFSLHMFRKDAEGVF